MEISRTFVPNCKRGGGQGALNRMQGRAVGAGGGELQAVWKGANAREWGKSLTQGPIPLVRLVLGSHPEAVGWIRARAGAAAGAVASSALAGSRRASESTGDFGLHPGS